MSHLLRAIDKTSKISLLLLDVRDMGHGTPLKGCVPKCPTSVLGKNVPLTLAGHFSAFRRAGRIVAPAPPSPDLVRCRPECKKCLRRRAFLLVWPISRHVRRKKSCPLYTQQRHQTRHSGMSALGHIT